MTTNATKTTRTKATRVSKSTTLVWGLASTEVALYKASGDPKDVVKIATAGPNGLALEKAAAQAGKRLPEAEAKRVSTSAPANVTADTDTDPLGAPTAPVDVAMPVNPITTEVFEVGSDTVLKPEEIRRGFLVGSGEDAVFTDATDALEYVDRTAATDEMRIRGFIARSSIRQARVCDAYYLGSAADVGSPKVVRLLWEAMRETGRVAVVTWLKGTREVIGVLRADEKGALVALEMRWAADMRDPGPRMLTHNTVEVTKSEVQAAVDLANAMAAPPSILDDQDRDVKRRLQGEVFALATAGKVDEFETEPAEVPVDDTLDIEALFAESAKALA